MNRANAPSESSLPPPGLRPQFRLLTLFLLITLVGLLFAAFEHLGPIGTFALILAILVVVAHVAGNAIGTTLRDGVRPSSQPQETAVVASAERPITPTTNLGENRPLGRLIYIVSAVGGLLTGAIGITVAHFLSAKPISLPSTIAGGLVLAALGAFWTFVAGSFLQVAFGAFLHALRGAKPPPANR